jgi:hypothetical protein
MKIVLLGLVLGGFLLVGCGPVGESQPGPTAAVAVVGTTTATEQSTTAVPGMPVGLCAGDCVVTDFSVWQDFMPSIPRAGAPLHATFTLEISWQDKITPTMAHGTITILRAGGEQVITADLQLNQWVDDQGLVQPGPQTVSFSMVPAPVAAQLVEGEMLHGTVRLTLGDQTLNIELPETALIFTH